MLRLNIDILFFIFKELKDDDDKFLYSCLLVNRLWCKIIVPILWSHYEYVEHLSLEKYKLWFNIILLHLPATSRNLLISKGISNIPIEQKLLFDYISYYKHISYYFIFPYIIY